MQGTSPLAYLDGQLIYVTYGGALMAVPFDGHAATGTPVPLVSDVVVDGLGAAKAAMSATGALIYRSGKAESQPVLARGAPTPLISEARNFSTPRFSPDGQRVAFTVTTPEATDVWVYDRVRATLTKVTSEGLNERPEWTADGKRLVFVGDRGGVTGFWSQAADGSAPAELLYKPLEGDPYEAVISRDGRWLVYRTGPAGKPPRSAFAVPLEGDRKAIALVTGKSYVQMPSLSPDGRWLAYQDNVSGVFEVYVRPFPGPGGRVQVSAGGGGEPVWARSGRALYYLNGHDVMSVGVTLGAIDRNRRAEDGVEWRLPHQRLASELRRLPRWLGTSHASARGRRRAHDRRAQLDARGAREGHGPERAVAWHGNRFAARSRAPSRSRWSSAAWWRCYRAG